MNINKETLLIYWRHAWQHKGFVLGLLISVPIAIITFQIIPPIIASNVLDRLSSGDFQHGDLWGSFGADIVLYGVLIILGGSLLWRVAIYFVWRLEMLVQRDISRRMFNHLMELDSNFHANSFGGSLVSRTNKLVGSYIRVADVFIFQFYTLFITMVVIGVIMWSRSPQYVLALYGFTLVYLMISILTTKKIRKLQSKTAQAENRQTGFLADMVTNILAVKSFSAEAFENKRYGRVTEQTHQSMRKVMRTTLRREAFFGTVTSGMQAIALAIAAASIVVLDAEIGSVFLILYYTSNVTQRLWDFSQHGLRNLNRGLGDAQEGTQTLLRCATVNNVKQNIPLEITRGDVAFENIVFSHDHSPLFNKFNLSIKAGEKVGLVGPSGGGKTTVTKLLLRFMDIQGGAITIDGQDISDARQQDLRHFISYVPQEPLLFHRSLSENIAYGMADATQADIIDASSKAHAHEFVTKLPEGYDTLVGERGVKLSGGQKQRVAIARSMIKSAPVIVLDEATSALDSESEQLIQDALWKLMEDKTAIVIAHRLSTIQKMDRIIVLDNGQIVEQGSHKELVAKKNGHYARLWAHQSGGFLDD